MVKSLPETAAWPIPISFLLLSAKGELMDMRDSFFGLTGLDIAFVDRNGMPVVSPWRILFLQRSLPRVEGGLWRINLWILLYKICCSPAMLIRLSLIVGDVA